MPDVEADVEYLPFLLDPATPSGGDDLRDRLRRRYGDPEPLFRRVEMVARADGIPLDFKRVERAPSTVLAHTLLRHARTKGTQRALSRGLFAAYFLEGRDIGDANVLGSLAEPHGITLAEVHRLATDPSEEARTREAANESLARGIATVPFMTFAGRVTLSGARSVDVLRSAISDAIAATSDD